MYKYTIQPYSPKAGTGLSLNEVNQPGSYDVTDTTVVAQFKVLSRQENYYVQSFMIISVQKIYNIINYQF
jgi:isoleucyl-tRNA synthetase